MKTDLKRVRAKAERLAQLAYRIAEIIVDLQKRAQDDSKMTTFCREI